MEKNVDGRATTIGTGVVGTGCNGGDLCGG